MAINDEITITWNPPAAADLEYDEARRRFRGVRLREISSPLAQCSDCRGSGKYVGLAVVEVCRGCGGSGLSQSNL